MEEADLAIVGAGAAGLMTAIAAGRARASGKPAKIVFFDTRPKVGAKILISGGTRCNVTNRSVRSTDYQGGPRHFISHVLEAFTPEQTMLFFEQLGVPLVLEPTGKYFPETHSGRTVLEALLREVGRLQIPLTAGCKIISARSENQAFEIRSEAGAQWRVARLALATGGLSYPETGSDGTGLRIAADFGHQLKTTAPSLTPLLTEDKDWRSLSGISLPVALSFYSAGKKRHETSDSFLFTHFGFSGPAALDLSRHVAYASGDWRVEARFLPEENEESLAKRLSAATRSSAKSHRFLSAEFSLPERFVHVLLKKSGLDPESPARSVKPKELSKWIQALLRYPLEVSGVYGYRKAEATAGGVDLKEVRVSSMESRLVPGLYFAGEILDVDGRIGGFNFQWAWSTGMIAGRSAMESLG